MGWRRRTAATLTLVVVLNGVSAHADVSSTGDIPDLTLRETRALENAAARGDDLAAEELYWRGGPERHRLRWLLKAATHGDCAGIEMAAEHFEAGRQWGMATRWVRAYQQHHCEHPEMRWGLLFLTRHSRLVEAAERGDCRSVEIVRRGIRQVGDTTSPWLEVPDRHGC